MFLLVQFSTYVVLEATPCGKKYDDWHKSNLPDPIDIEAHLFDLVLGAKYACRLVPEA